MISCFVTRISIIGGIRFRFGINKKEEEIQLQLQHPLNYRRITNNMISNNLTAVGIVLRLRSSYKQRTRGLQRQIK